MPTNRWDNYVAMLNAIRNEASQRYSNAVPSADGTVENLKTIGAVITSNQAFANEWLDALYNRIAITRVLTMDAWRNPLRDFKRRLEYGESYLEVAMHLNSVYTRDYANAKDNIFNIYTPGVESSLYHVNSEFFYPASVLPAEIRKAFLSFEALDDFVNQIINNVYRTMEYDEYNAMLYCILVAVKNGMPAVEIPAVSAANAREIVTRVKAASNEMEFLSTDKNISGVPVYAGKDDQYIFLNTALDAVVDVNVLALAFNMSVSAFSGRRRLFSDFSKIDFDRLDVLFANDPLYERPSDAEIAEFAKIPAFLISGGFFVAFDQFTEMYSNENGAGPYRNYFLHCGRIYSYSNFAPGVYFVTGAQSITSVSIDPATAEMAKGDLATFKAEVVAVNLADPRVVWSVPQADEDKVRLDTIDGQTVSVRLLEALGVGESITLTATSVFDNTKTATATISPET